MTKMYIYVAGNTMDSHKKFVKKLKKRGAKIVDSPDESDVAVIFCPIVSRFETDVKSALSSIEQEELREKDVILVAMHHTFDPKYTIPRHGAEQNPFIVDCLFHEKTGLLRCSRNRMAVKMVRKEMGLRKVHLCI